jgi:hypothetical protein
LSAGLLLLVPTVYLVLALSTVQSAALAVDGATRQAARVFVSGQDEESARSFAEQAVAVTFADYGVPPESARVTIECRPHPRDCLTRRGFVTVSVTAAVTLPLVPPLLNLDTASRVRVSSTATEQVSRFAGEAP